MQGICRHSRGNLGGGLLLSFAALRDENVSTDGLQPETKLNYVPVTKCVGGTPMLETVAGVRLVLGRSPHNHQGAHSSYLGSAGGAAMASGGSGLRRFA